MVMSDRTVSASSFKTHCLALLDEVAATGEQIVVTKRGRPVARVVAVDEPDGLEGSVRFNVSDDELIAPLPRELGLPALVIVLDTHVWLWWLAQPDRLSSRARQAIDGASRIGICTLSAWEVAALSLRGRISLDRNVGCGCVRRSPLRGLKPCRRARASPWRRRCWTVTRSRAIRSTGSSTPLLARLTRRSSLAIVPSAHSIAGRPCGDWDDLRARRRQLRLVHRQPRAAAQLPGRLTSPARAAGAS